MTSSTLRHLYERVIQQGAAEHTTQPSEDLPPLFPEYFLDNVPRHARIIELGAGAGAFAGRLLNAGYRNVFVSDFNLVSLSEAALTLGRNRTLLSDAEELGLADHSFDVVVSIEMIEHLLDVDRHLSEVRRVLRAGGLYILRTPNRVIADVYYLLMRQDDIHIWHPSMMTYFGLRNALRAKGFSVAFLRPHVLPRSQRQKLPKAFGLDKLAEHIITRVTPGMLQPSLLCIARLKSSTTTPAENVQRGPHAHEV